MRLWYHIVTIEISPLVDFYLCCLRGSTVCFIMFWFLAALIDGFWKRGFGCLNLGGVFVIR